MKIFLDVNNSLDKMLENLVNILNIKWSYSIFMRNIIFGIKNRKINW